MSKLYESLLTVSPEGVGGSRPPRASAAVVPWRRSPSGGLEVFWVRRAPGVPFMAGWHAFPGGGVSRRDAAVSVDGQPRGLSPDGFTAPSPDPRESRVDAVGPDLVPGLLAATLRELFEETGLLLARDDRGFFARIPSDEAESLRRGLADRSVDLDQLVRSRGWTLDGSSLVFGGRWLTPPLAPLRFDNRFFLLEWPADGATQPSVLGRELDRGEWIDPAAALAAWRAGEATAAPPILHILRVLAEDGPEAGLGRLLSPVEADLGPMRRIEFRPGIVLVPLRTATLPPATHTHAFLLGREPAVLVDPGCHDEREIRRLLEVLAAFRDAGGDLRDVWLTHAHPDHTGAVPVLRRELGLRVRAHRDAGPTLARSGIEIDEDLRDDEVVDLDGPRVRVLHTPGHAPGHLAFFDESTRSLLAGDLISALSTIVVDPPSGDMDDYLASLERVLELRPTTVFPAHGPVLLGPDRIRSTRDHRLERERQILDAWSERGLRTPEDLARHVYSETPQAFLPLAARQVLAHLQRLERAGSITR